MSTQSRWLWVVGIPIVGGVLLALGVPIQYVLLGGVLLLCPAMMLFMAKKGRDENSRKEPDPSSDTASGRSDTERKS